MKQSVQFCLVVILTMLVVSTSDAQWRCLYATWDTGDTNGTGHNTPSLGVIQEDMFIALVMTPDTRNFMIPYVDADSALGRVYSYGYGGSTSGIYQVWTDGLFDQVPLLNAPALAVTPDSLIYVANNDPNHNILVFKYTNDTITVVPPFPRQVTGSTRIFGIEVDGNGYVYVCNDTSMGVANDLKVYAPISQWSPAHNDPPIQTIDLPDGIYKGLYVSPGGDQLFISDYGNRAILKFVGSPATGYTQDLNFNFQLSPSDTIAGEILKPSVIGLGYLGSNNILFAAVDVHGYSAPTQGTYSYGRMYLLNPNTGEFASPDSAIRTIDVAAWNFALTGDYNLRTDGKIPGNASGYTSTYDLDFDENGFLYSQSHFGWTVEKWEYQGMLPVITSVEQVPGQVPDSYKLNQNYPNPFNPATTIEFSLFKSGFVSLKVFSLLGQEVATLVDEERSVGNYRVTFDARDLPSGTYFYTLSTGGFTEIKKMLLLR